MNAGSSCPPTPLQQHGFHDVKDCANGCARAMSYTSSGDDAACRLPPLPPPLPNVSSNIHTSRSNSGPRPCSYCGTPPPAGRHRGRRHCRMSNHEIQNAHSQPARANLERRRRLQAASAAAAAKHVLKLQVARVAADGAPCVAVAPRLAASELRRARRQALQLDTQNGILHCRPLQYAHAVCGCCSRTRHRRASTHGSPGPAGRRHESRFLHRHPFTLPCRVWLLLHDSPPPEKAIFPKAKLKKLVS